MKEVSHYKKLLETERDQLVAELEKIGTKDVDKPDKWVIKPADMEIMQADRNEAADKTEETQVDSGVLNELETRYRSVLHALGKIEAGSYGTCELADEPIEEDRLDANPAARTCKKHLGGAEKLIL